MPNSYTFSALVLGATGQVGKEIVRELANNERVPKVTLLLRRPFVDELVPSSPNSPPVHLSSYTKFDQHIIDFENLPEYSYLFAEHDVVICALGTHSSYSADRQSFYKVDHHYVLDCARLAKDAGCHHFIAITVKGASPHSKLFYLKVKGEVEEDLKAMHFYRLSIYKPGILLSNPLSRVRGRPPPGWFESVLTSVMRTVDIWRHASVDTGHLAKVIVNQCFAPKMQDVEIYDNKLIHDLAVKSSKNQS